MSEPQSILRPTDATLAYGLFRDAVEQNKGLFDTLQTVEAFTEGANPDTPLHTAEQGTDETSNVNFQMADALAVDVEGMYWNRYFNEPTLASFRSNDIEDAASRLVLDRALSERFTTLLKSLPSFHTNFATFLADYVRVGRAYRYFPDDESLKDEILHFSDVLLPARAPVDPNEWTSFFIRRNETVHRLYNLIKDEESIAAAEAEGYSVAEIRRLIFAKEAAFLREEDIKAKASLVADFDEDNPLFVGFWESFESQAGQVEFLDTEAIPVVCHYVKEFSGKWSVKSFCTLDQLAGAPQYYRKIEEKYENVYEFLIPAFFRPRRSATDSRGFIHRSFNELSMNNDILNSMVDLLPWLTSVIADKVSDGGNSPKAVVIRNKGNVITLEGGSINANAMQAIRSDQAVAIYKTLSAVMEMKRKYSPSGMGSNFGSVQPISSQEAMQLSASASDAQMNAVAIFDSQFVHYFREVFRRLLKLPKDENKDVEDFWAGLARDGFAPKDIQSASVCVTPSIGYGNTQARQAAIADVLKSADTLGIDTLGKARLSRLYIVSRLGADAARDTLSPDERARPTASEREAYKENLFLNAGQPIPVLLIDDHLAHVVVHYREVVAPLLQAANSGGIQDFSGPYKTLAATVAHLEDHARYVQPGSSADAIKSAIKQATGLLQAVASAYQQQVAAMQQQQAQNAQTEQQRIEMDANLRKYELDLKHLVDRLDMEAQNRIRFEKAVAKIEGDQLRLAAKLNEGGA